MNILRNPTTEEVTKALTRPTEESSQSVFETVSAIFEQVKQDGDSALVALSKRFDGIALSSLAPRMEERTAALSRLDSTLRSSLERAIENITKFHEAQRQDALSIETSKGIRCERMAVPIERVGLYIPAGTAPLFSTLLMLAIPAKLAGCREIVLVSPPNIHPTILAVCEMLELTEVYQVGGAQAIAALTFGTETIRPVAKLFGPGNQYVTAAKQLASQLTAVAIDMPAGPSELLVIADEGMNPAFVAADLLSQAEHGVDSQVVFLTDSEELLQNVIDEVQIQLSALPREDIARAALANSSAILVGSIDEAMTLSNRYAPEHLIIATKDAETRKPQVLNAASVFLGYYTPESLGDYASGTNHTLPTGGAAKAYSGISLESFQKQITFQTATAEGLFDLGPVVEAMAEAEGLAAHKNAVTVRTRSL